MLDSSCRPRLDCQLPPSGWSSWMKETLQETENNISLQVLPIDLFQFNLDNPTNDIWFAGNFVCCILKIQ